MMRACSRLTALVCLTICLTSAVWACGPKQSGAGPDKIVVPYEAPAGQPPPVGAVAADFTLTDSEGRPVQLSQLAAAHKSVAVIYYRGHW